MSGLNNGIAANTVWYVNMNTVEAPVKQDVPSALSTQLTELKNSTAEFFTAVKNSISSAAGKFGDWVNKLSVRRGQPEIKADMPSQPLKVQTFSQILLASAKECLPKHLEALTIKLSNKEPMQPGRLAEISGGPLRGIITQLSSISSKIQEPGTEGIREMSENLLNGEVNRDKFSQLGSIADLARAKEHLAKPGFEAGFRERVAHVVSEIRLNILPVLEKL